MEIYSLESEHQGVANLGIGVWSSSGEDEAFWYVHDRAIRLLRNLNQVLQILECAEFRLSRQFCEVCDGAEAGESIFMRKLQVYRGVPASYLDRSGLETVGTRWVYSNKGDAANPFIRARLVAQETKRVSELTPEDPLECLKVTLSRCMTGKRRALAE